MTYLQLLCQAGGKPIANGKGIVASFDAINHAQAVVAEELPVEGNRVSTHCRQSTDRRVAACVEVAKETALGLNGAPRETVLNLREKCGDRVSFPNLYSECPLGRCGCEPVDR